MKALTKLLIMIIVTTILTIIFATIAALVPVLKSNYVVLAFTSGTLCFVTFLIWVAQTSNLKY